jgi:hypothetical protein
MCIYIYIYTYISTQICVYLYTDTYTNEYMYILIRIYEYIYIYVHTYLYTYIFIYRNLAVGNEMMLLFFSRDPRFKTMYTMLLDALERFSVENISLKNQSSSSLFMSGSSDGMNVCVYV